MVQVPSDLEASRAIAWRFLRSLEARSDDYEHLSSPDARVRSTTNGRTRSLRSAWHERRSSPAAQSSALGPRLELTSEVEGSRDDEELGGEPSRLTFRVTPTISPTSAGGSVPAWYLVLAATARGPRVLEVLTSDGLLP